MKTFIIEVPLKNGDPMTPFISIKADACTVGGSGDIKFLILPPPAKIPKEWSALSPRDCASLVTIKIFAAGTWLGVSVVE